MVYDLIVLGGGPGGYVAAERAGEKGLKVLLIERGHLGGVCLNEGCIPSKALLNAAKHFYYTVHGEAYGITVTDAHFDLAKAHEHKNAVMERLRTGVAGLMKRYKVEVVNGVGTLASPTTVRVDDTVYEGRNILVAAGSSPAHPPIKGADLPHVVTSTGMLETTTLPQQLVVVGGGIIGCEFACVFGSIGVPVTVIEMLPEICPTVDGDIAKMLRSELAGKNITFHTGARVEEITPDAVTFSINGETQSVPADLVLLATGRVPNVERLGLENAGVDFDRRGIRIDETCATNVPGVWAVGDITGKTWLAHSASRMGEVVVNNITGRHDRMRFDAIAGVIYTNPEVASVGLTEAAAEKRGIPVVSAKMPMMANGRFLAENAKGKGIVKVVVHRDTRAILGVHMLGGVCSEMIYGAAVMIETECRIDEIRDIVFPHPTTSEIIRDTILTLN